jgi:diguanylate cyclase (GGDEF)-like protein
MFILRQVDRVFFEPLRSDWTCDVGADQAVLRPRYRRSALIMAPVTLPFVALLALWGGPAPSGAADPGLLMLGFLGGLIWLADSVHHGRTTSTISDLSFLIYMAAVCHFGLAWEVVAVAAGARFMAHLSLPPRSWPATINAGLVTIEMVIGGAVFLLLEPRVPLLVAALGMASIRLLANNVVICALPITGPFLEEMNDATEWKELGFVVPFLATGIAAAEYSPATALIGMFGCTMLSLLSTKSQDELVVAEARLDRDAKTGLRNAERFWTDLKREILLADERRLDIAVLMIDIDDFKVLNDTHGHIEGDRALLLMADTLTRSVRDHDVAARYGGEEFAVIIPSASAREAHAIAERIRATCAVALAPWNTTVSIGLAMREPGGPEAEDFLDIADQALYRAKRSGKNQVVTTLRTIDDELEAA